MGKWEILGLKAVKGVGNAGNMGFRLFITPQDDNAIKTFEKLLNRVEVEVDGYFSAVPIGDGVYIKIQRFKDEKGRFWLYAVDYYENPMDMDKDDLEKFIEILQAEYTKITKPEQYTFALRPHTVEDVLFYKEIGGGLE